MRLQLPQISDEEATDFIISYLRRGEKSQQPFSDGFGFDLYLPDVVSKFLDPQREEWLRNNPQRGMVSFEIDTATNSQPFYDAAWNLCVRGILRPGVLQHDPQYHRAFIVSAGYSITQFGRSWLADTAQYECLPTEYKRFSELLAAHANRYGAAYYLRSQEAVKCYRAHTYLASCVMCGAAAEAILLTLAIAKIGDEQQVLREYMTTTGRTKIENKLLAHANSYIQQDLRNYTNLLKYWRDAAAHGAATNINEGEAFTSLLLLLRFAQFASDRWEELTT